MAYAASPVAPKTTGISKLLRDSFDRVKEAYDRRAAVTATRNELSALSDRDLEDIGLTRGDIEAVALGAKAQSFYKPS